LAYVDIKVGEGAAPGPTDVAEVHYKGWFPDGEQFDSSAGKDPYPVNMARPNVITGWVEALTTMKQGGKRRVIIPPHLAYGPSGRPGIPPNAVLLFDMELVSVKKAGKDE
jgi:FKBP-type peptidyl-prolyl cis-trans isomerase FkpA/FKBP-type peptidyl-prolyl cis-trans isomerase FklB